MQTLLHSTNRTNIMQQPGENSNNGNPRADAEDSNSGQCTIKYETTGNITGVPRVQNFTFQDEETAFLWFSQIMPLRIEQTRLFRQGVVSPAPGLAWLQRFNTFHQQWGSEFVPIDVRSSVHYTQNHLGLPLTQW